MQNNAASAQHTVVLTGRSTAAITGVEEVECFNEQIVVLRTPPGSLTLTGSGLNISQLSLDDGRLLVEGEILSLEYAENRRAPGKGLLGRIFG